MKVFLLVCLAAAVYAEPEADPLMVYNGLHTPLVYNTHVPAVQYAAQPVLKAVQPVVSYAQPAVTYAHQPVVYNAALPVAQRATVHQTPALKGPGGEVAAKTAVAGDLTSYTVYHGLNKDKRSADSEADPALLLKSAYAGVPVVNSAAVAYNPYYASSVYQPAVYNTAAYTAAYTTPVYNTYGGLRVVKREAESEADPALLYRSAYTAGVPVVNSAVYSPYYATSGVRQVVSSPYYSTLGYRLGWY